MATRITDAPHKVGAQAVYTPLSEGVWITKPSDIDTDLTEMIRTIRNMDIKMSDMSNKLHGLNTYVDSNDFDALIDAMRLASKEVYDLIKRDMDDLTINVYRELLVEANKVNSQYQEEAREIKNKILTDLRAGKTSYFNDAKTASDFRDQANLWG